MVKKTLVGELIADGAKLLHELGRQNFPVEAMFWVELPERDYWRLVISSPVVGNQGPKAAYSKIGEVLRGMSAEGLDLAEISVFAPDSQQFHDLLSVAQRSGGPVVGSAWVVLNEAVVYRWNSDHLAAMLDCNVDEAQLKELWERERQSNPFSLPRLLFDVAGQRVTLRLHPAHGTLKGLRNIKKPFQTAIKRPNAFPGCKVKWVD